MDSETRKSPQVQVRVTREEYEQFLQGKTFLPDCLPLDARGTPGCDGRCPQDLVCVLFRYVELAANVDVAWYACAPPEQVAALGDRAVPLDEAQAARRPKFIGFNSD